MGKVGEVDPPKCIMPLLLIRHNSKEKKQTLVYDCRLLNLYNDKKSLSPKKYVHDSPSVTKWSFLVQYRRKISLENALGALEVDICNCRLDAEVDNMAVVAAWEKGCSKDTTLNSHIIKILHWAIERNIDLRVSYVRSADNAADAPSRRSSVG